MLLLENSPLEGGNSNSVLSQAIAHHHGVDYFPIAGDL